MASEQYKKLVDDLCKLVNMPVQPSLYQRVDLEIDKVFFSLVEAKAATSKKSATAPAAAPKADSGTSQDGMVAVFCDFGPLPRHQRQAAMQRLLELNLSLQGEELPVMSMNHENGHVLLSRRLPLAGMAALDLLNKMKDHAGQAKEWRDGGCFLKGDGKPAVHKSEGARRQFLRFANAD